MNPVESYISSYCTEQAPTHVKEARFGIDTASNPASSYLEKKAAPRLTGAATVEQTAKRIGGAFRDIVGMERKPTIRLGLSSATTETELADALRKALHKKPELVTSLQQALVSAGGGLDMSKIKDLDARRIVQDVLGEFNISVPPPGMPTAVTTVPTPTSAATAATTAATTPASREPAGWLGKLFGKQFADQTLGEANVEKVLRNAILGGQLHPEAMEKLLPLTSGSPLVGSGLFAGRRMKKLLKSPYIQQFAGLPAPTAAAGGAADIERRMTEAMVGAMTSDRSIKKRLERILGTLGHEPAAAPPVAPSASPTVPIAPSPVDRAVERIEGIRAQASQLSQLAAGAGSRELREQSQRELEKLYRSNQGFLMDRMKQVGRDPSMAGRADEAMQAITTGLNAGMEPAAPPGFLRRMLGIGGGRAAPASSSHRNVVPSLGEYDTAEDILRHMRTRGTPGINPASSVVPLGVAAGTVGLGAQAVPFLSGGNRNRDVDTIAGPISYNPRA